MSKFNNKDHEPWCFKCEKWISKAESHIEVFVTEIDSSGKISEQATWLCPYCGHPGGVNMAAKGEFVKIRPKT